MSSAASFSENEKDVDLKVEDSLVELVQPAVVFTEAEEDALHRRMDWKVMPILALLYRKSRVLSGERMSPRIVRLIQLFAFFSICLGQKLTSYFHAIVMSFLDRGNIGNAR
jgi:hypothetical protein